MLMGPNPVVTVQGNRIFVEYRIWDNRPSPRIPYDPDEGVWIDVYNPSGAKVVTQDPVPKISAGLYRYEYQLATDAPLGAWVMQLTAEYENGSQSVSRKSTVLIVE